MLSLLKYFLEPHLSPYTFPVLFQPRKCLLLLKLLLTRLGEKCESVSGSVGSNSLWSHGVQPARILCPQILQAGILEWVTFPSPAELPNPGIKPRSPILQADSLLSEPPRKPQAGKRLALLLGSVASSFFLVILTKTQGLHFLILS